MFVVTVKDLMNCYYMESSNLDFKNSNGMKDFVSLTCFGSHVALSDPSLLYLYPALTEFENVNSKNLRFATFEHKVNLEKNDEGYFKYTASYEKFLKTKNELEDYENLFKRKILLQVLELSLANPRIFRKENEAELEFTYKVINSSNYPENEELEKYFLNLMKYAREYDFKKYLEILY